MCSGCGGSRPELSPRSFPGEFTCTHNGCFIDFHNDSGHDLEELDITFTFHFTDGSQQLRSDHWKGWANQEVKHVQAVEKPDNFLVSVVGNGTSSAYRVRFGALLPDETSYLDEEDMPGTNESPDGEVAKSRTKR